MREHKGFTPGPWMVRAPSDVALEDIAVGCFGDDAAIATISGFGRGSEANARLIADAPRLYAENQRMLKAFEAFIRGDERAEQGSAECVQNMIDDARAFLKEAGRL